MRRALIALALGASTAACSPPGFVELTPPPPPPSVPLDELVERYTEALCAAREQCFGPYNRRNPLSPDFDGGCVGVLRPYVTIQVERHLRPAVARGAVIYDADGVGAYLRALPGAYCTERFTDGRSVLELGPAVVPLLGPGDACFSDLECGDLQYCDVSATCPGRCVPQKASGQECVFNEECLPNAACVRARCAPKRSVSESCGGSEPSCTHPLQCGYVLGAVASCISPSAMAIQGDGERCAPLSDPFQCLPGLSCQANNAQGLDMSCRAPSGQGGPCALTSFLDGCADGLYCRPPASGLIGDCQPTPTAGEPCARGALADTVCAAGLRCNGDGVCQPMRSHGEPCTAEGECVSGSCVGGVCRPDQDICYPPL